MSYIESMRKDVRRLNRKEGDLPEKCITSFVFYAQTQTFGNSFAGLSQSCPERGFALFS
jgi:hypothetical protein